MSDSATNVLRPRRVNLTRSSHLSLDPDTETGQRYLVRFVGFDRDRAAKAATEHARVQQMMANLRGKGVYPYPLPESVTIGYFDEDGWHCGRSEYARSLVEMSSVQDALNELQNDLLLRVALVAAAKPNPKPSSAH